MKRIAAVLIVLCVGFSLFAAGSVKVGGMFNFANGSTKDFKDPDGEVLEKSALKYKTSGVGFDISGKYDINGTFAAWVDFNMTFCFDLKSKDADDTEWHSANDEYKTMKEAAEAQNGTATKKYNVISFAGGVAHSLSLDLPVEVSVGCGLFFDRAISLLKASAGDNSQTITIKASNIGLSLLLDAEYKLTESIGVGLTLRPHVGLLNFTSYETAVKYGNYEGSVTSKASGFAISFAMPVVIGASYAF